MKDLQTVTALTHLIFDNFNETIDGETLKSDAIFGWFVDNKFP